MTAFSISPSFRTVILRRLSSSTTNPHIDCSVPVQTQEQVLEAEEYAQGHLDWYSFDRVVGSLGGPVDPGEQVAASSFLPTPVTFQGMPDPRWWALEDRKTDLGSVKPSTTDVAQLLLMEFALVYANDMSRDRCGKSSCSAVACCALSMAIHCRQRKFLPGQP
jgi:hypothetical protein